MNSTCHGDFFVAISTYRCMGNGKTLITEGVPSKCPFCHRDVTPTVHETTTVRTVVIEQVLLNNTYVELRRFDGDPKVVIAQMEESKR